MNEWTAKVVPYTTILFSLYFPHGEKNISLKLQAINKTQSRVLKPSNAANVKPTLKAIKQAATKIYEDINGPFQELFGMSFAKAQTKTPELCLQEKKSQAELRKQRRERLRAEKKQMEEHWSNRDCDTMLATRQTYMQRQEQRLALFFETPEDAENRSAKRKDSEDHGLFKRKRHSPKPEDLQFDKDGLLQEVKTMKDGDKVRLSIYLSVDSISIVSLICWYGCKLYISRDQPNKQYKILWLTNLFLYWFSKW